VCPYPYLARLQEEIRDPDLFWNRITMKKALIAGAAFATSMGDSASAAAYTSTMQAINATLYSSHWTGAFVQETTSRTRDTAVRTWRRPFPLPFSSLSLVRVPST
jgi:hypothetical protein